MYKCTEKERTILNTVEENKRRTKDSDWKTAIKNIELKSKFEKGIKKLNSEIKKRRARHKIRLNEKDIKIGLNIKINEIISKDIFLIVNKLYISFLAMIRFL